MINKIVALLLSAGLVFLQPTNLANASVSKLTADVPITVDKQQAIYEQYNCEVGPAYKEFVYGAWKSTTLWMENKNFPTSGVEWKDASDVDNLLLYPTSGGRTVNTSTVRVGESFYNGTFYTGGTVAYETICDDKDKNMSIVGHGRIREITGRKVQTVTKGTYIADITAVNGSLPTNGKHTDGHWYVLKKVIED